MPVEVSFLCGVSALPTTHASQQMRGTACCITTSLRCRSHFGAHVGDVGKVNTTALGCFLRYWMGLTVTGYIPFSYWNCKIQELSFFFFHFFCWIPFSDLKKWYGLSCHDDFQVFWLSCRLTGGNWLLQSPPQQNKYVEPTLVIARQ